MFLSDVSVKRPVFAAVISLMLLAFGILSFGKLPLREYPDIDSPVVSVDTGYPGASAEVVETRITEIIEDRIAGIEGIRTIESASVDGHSEITIEFNLERDIDAAANDVRDRVGRVVDRLPEEADPPEISKVESNASPIAWLNLVSSDRNQMELTDYADRYIRDRISVVKGVARVRLAGQRPSMRIWLNRQAMAARQLTVNDIEQALRSENIELPAGSLETPVREFSVRMARNYRTPQEFASLPLGKGPDGHVTRLGEVSRIELAAQEERSFLHGNGEPLVGMGIIRQSKANTVDVMDGVQRAVEQIQQDLPEDMNLFLGHDGSVYIRAAIEEVYRTLGIALGLVVLVIYLFLGSGRAMLVPAVVVPVCLVATFAVLYALGFSINLLTLLALVLSIGLVVDDSIVVLENISRRIENGEPPLLASYRGARQVTFAVIATTLVIVAVFAPIAFISGNIGRLFTELAFTVSGAVIFSSILALSLSPMMCSKLLTASDRRGRLNRFVDKIFNHVSATYRKTLIGLFTYSGWVVLGVVGVFVGVAIILRAVPTELTPSEDRGTIFVMMEGPEGASFDYSKRHMEEIEEILLEPLDEGLAYRVLAFVPMWGAGTDYSSGGALLNLVPWDERDVTTDDVLNDLRAKLSRIPGVRALAFMPQGFSGGGARQPVQFVIGGSTYEELAGWRDTILRRAQENPGLINVQADLEDTKPQFRITVDKSRAADLGVSVQVIGRTLETLMAGREVTTFIDDGEEYPVLLRASAEDRRTPADLDGIYVRSERSGELVPLSNLIAVEERGDFNQRNRFNRLRAVTITANLAPGYRLGDALAFLENIARTQLPQSAQIDYKGDSRELQESSTSLLFSFGMALLIVYLVLAAQFESFIHPFVIMTTVPLGVIGGLIGLFLFDSSLNVYSQIGIIILIGIAAKNGILIVEFANQLRDQGRAFETALLDAAQIRLRPIIMTSLSTAIGTLPLILSTGAGAESRFTIGIVIFSGVTVASLFTLFVVPVFYHILARYTGSPGTVARHLRELEQDRPATAGQS